MISPYDGSPAIRVRLSKPLRAGQNAETIIKEGATVWARYRSVPPGVRGFSGYVAKIKGKEVYFDDSYVEEKPK